jgi:hypothetical protein
MRKAKLTIEEHREIGKALKTFRNERLINYAISIENATPKNSRQSKAARKALDAIDELRNVMDDLVCEDYFDEIGDAFKEIYYGAEEPKKGAGK